VDLDDTLWGGVVGEVGAGGITIGVEGVGLAFADLQRELLRLQHHGVLLVMCTKNDPEYALAAFDHPEMILRREHFVAERVNWRDKATNLREMARELGLGLDAFVLLDDNPRERDWVRQALPQVVVPELPDDPTERPAFVARIPSFATLAVTDDDRRRTASYYAQGERRQAQSGARSFDDYLASLDQRVTLEPLSERTLPRAAQLCQKTNQFNLLTRRHTQGDLERMLADPAHDVLTVSVADRFGDSGITGVTVVRIVDDQAEIDTLLLSCRVLGRRVEDAVLAVLVRRARERGARTLCGRYAPTERNGQVATFYPERGFAPVGENTWALDLDASRHAAPASVTIEEVSHA
jgi:FkbH-like protein